MAPPTVRSDAEDAALAASARTLGAPLVVGTLAVALLAALAYWSGMGSALQRPLWLDEIVSQLIASDPLGIGHGMRSGADFQPPPHYALVRLVQFVANAATPAVVRAPSALAAILCIALLAATLRSTLSVAAAFAGAITLAAHPLFLAQAVEARPYALWILATLLTAVALGAPRPARPWLIAVASALLCSVHYFGVLSLAAIGLVEIVAGRVRREPLPQTLRSVLPFCAGMAALGALLPLARTQLLATGGRSWVPPVTSQQVAYFLAFPWGWRPAALLIVTGAIAFAIGRFPLTSSWRWRSAMRPSWNPVLAALLATALVPLLVIGISVAYKPVLVLRYAAPAALAVAVAVALAVEALPTVGRWIAVLLLVRAAAFSFSSTAAAARQSSAVLAAEQYTMQQLRARSITTVSPFRHDAYRMDAMAGAGAVAWIELSDSLLERAARTPDAGLTRDFLLLERDFGRSVRRTFDFPATMSLEAARAAGTIALLRESTHAAADSIWLPGRQVCSLTERLAVFSPRSAPISCPGLRAALQGRARR